MSQSGGGSQQHHDSSSGAKTVTIKIASKDPNQRNSAGGADPGPGDMNAAPSEAPQVMDIPEPPTSSQLVIKSTSTGGAGNSQKLATMNALRSGTGSSAGGGGTLKSASLGPSGSQAGPAASNPSVSAGREPTSSRPLTGPSENMSQSGGGGGGGGKSTSGAGGSSGGAAGPSGMGSSRGSPKAIASPGGTSGASEVHDEDEEGEGELETEPSPGPSGASTPASSPKSGAGSASSQFGPGKSGRSQSGAPVGSSAKSGGSSMGAEPSKSAPKSSGPLIPASSAASSKSGKKDDKKVTRFRYHKRITVRTHGKTNPSAIMSKVNKGVTPSTIDELDPKELMKRAGIKNTKHWRIRLRQTKRVTKNGKTTTQTKVAYRDSSGNKVVPNCKKCGKKLDDCKCDKPQPDR